MKINNFNFKRKNKRTNEQVDTKIKYKISNNNFEIYINSRKSNLKTKKINSELNFLLTYFNILIKKIRITTIVYLKYPPQRQ